MAKTKDDVYKERREDELISQNQATLTINGVEFNITEWIPDLAFRMLEVSETMKDEHLNDLYRDLFDTACLNLYSIVNDHWIDEYSNDE